MLRRSLSMIALTLALLAQPMVVDAQTQANEQLVRSVERVLPRYAPNVDARTLSSHQIASLHMVLHGRYTESQKRARVRGIIGGLDVLLFGRNLTFR